MSEAVIELKNLSIGYGPKKVVGDVNTKIYKGDLVGIVGCNGAGKSTLLKTIRGLLPMQSGEVLYFNKPLADYDDKELARNIAYLQQQVELGFGYTGRDVVLAGRYPFMKWWESETEDDEKLAMACMDYTGTLDLADRALTEVSGGQKQRILWAKVLAQQTPILVLDDPTNGLDMVYQEELFRFAKQLVNMGKTILMVVHELNFAAKYCNRIMLLGEQHILADDVPEKVFTEELLSRAYHAKIKVVKNPATDSIEISTRVDAEKIARENELLNQICK